MNYLDVIISVFLIIFSLKGFSKGLIKEIISITSLVVAVYTAVNFSFYLEKKVFEYASEYERYVPLISFFILFSGVLISFKITAYILQNLVSSLNLTIINKVLGLFFGGLKIAIIISIVFCEISRFEDKIMLIIPENQKEESILYKPVKEFFPKTIPIVKKAKEAYMQNL